jgi:hypothetical protein
MTSVHGEFGNWLMVVGHPPPLCFGGEVENSLWGRSGGELIAQSSINKGERQCREI